MNKLIFSVLVVVGSAFSVIAQQKFHLGIEASPAWDINAQKQKTTGIRTSVSGYGFNIGVPIKWFFKENIALQTGLGFEYMVFDNRFNGTLISSERYGQAHVPLMFNYGITDSWFANFGAGINYTLFASSWAGNAVNVTNQTKQFQPYVGLGASTLVERDKGMFELGAQVRYHFLELFADGTVLANQYNSRIISFDLLLRFYLFNR